MVFKFNTQADHSKYKPMDNKRLQRGYGQGHVTNF